MNAYGDDLLDREVVTTRVFDAPWALVFRAWTEPEHLMQWWGPKGFTNTFHEFEMRTGGKWRFTMHGPNGAEYLNEVEFEEVTPPERLIWKHVSMPHFQLTVLFEELSGGALRLLSASSLRAQKSVGRFAGLRCRRTRRTLTSWLRSSSRCGEGRGRAGAF